jgi:hypothetical protein
MLSIKISKNISNKTLTNLFYTNALHVSKISIFDCRQINIYVSNTNFILKVLPLLLSLDVYTLVDRWVPKLTKVA